MSDVESLKGVWGFSADSKEEVLWVQADEDAESV